MLGNGIMQEIRTLLSQGKSSGEVIALGYKPPTVYKVQRQLKRKGQDNRGAPVQRIAQGLVANADTEALADLEAENWELRRRAEMLEAQLSEANSLRFQVDQAQARIEELESEAQQAEALRAQLIALRGEVQDWQRKTAEMKKALEQAEQHVREAQRVNQALMPLMVWAGHPCYVCGRPTDGVVDRETAAHLLEFTGHKECLIKAGLIQGNLFLVLAEGRQSGRATVLSDRHRNGLLIVS